MSSVGRDRKAGAVRLFARRRPILVALVLFSLCAHAPGGDGDKPAPTKVPETVSAAADEVARLATVPGVPGLAQLASALQLDPWLVADELCARGAFDAADVFARAAPPTKRGGLLAFISGQRRTPTDPARRAAYKSAGAAREAGKPADGIKIIDAAGEPVADVVSVRLLNERAFDVGLLGDPRAEIAALRALVERVRAMDWPVREADLTMFAASRAQQIGDFELGAQLWARLSEIHHGFSAPVDEGGALQKIALMRFNQGRLGEALTTMRRALPLIRQGGEGVVLGRACSALALYEDAAGDLANAMVHHEEALRLLGRSPSAKERVLATMNASRTSYRLNDLAGAIALADRALADPAFDAASAARPDRNLTSIRGQVLLNRADYRTASDDLDAALADLEQAARAFADAGDRPMSARAAGQRGNLLSKRRDFDGAANAYEESLATAEALGDRSLLGVVRLDIGNLAEIRGAHDEAIRSCEAAILDARAAGSAHVESKCLRQIAAALLAKGSDGEALARAREAIALESRRTRGLGADEAATLATGDRSSTEIGLTAARKVGDLAAWFEIAESGRASALAESVGGRAAIQVAAVSDALTAESAAAAVGLAHATDEVTNARASGELAATRAAAAKETSAKERVRVVQDRIERRKKLAAGLDAPAPPTLEHVRRHIGKARALVVFHVGQETAEALVVAEDGARLVDLGTSAAFVAQCDAVRAGDSTVDDVAAAKATIVDGLKLPKEIRTLLVVPDGPVATVPFALLAPDRDAAIVPSALVWTLLDAARSERGAGVLAVGDPDYAGTKLVQLPATRAEASAVGTRVLLGKDATEDAVRRALVESPRWHAVHFACHGVVDPRHASLCGLALTRAGTDDGMFTAREILGLAVPADVVVLSACEAGRPGAGASAATGLPPAFLAAGCARVVANLWKIDDEAGRVFSVAYHLAWAKDGVTAAQALREGRDAVRADTRFAAPRHWAGWVLWGLPE